MILMSLDCVDSTGLTYDGVSNVQPRDSAVPGILLCGQGLKTTAVFRLEYHRPHGEVSMQTRSDFVYCRSFRWLF